MSIQEHLNKIRNAIYGREVRESIAKGIETAYDDASENGNANMEVKIARGTHPNLRSRLEEVDSKQQQTTAQLAQKADQLDLDVERARINSFTTLAEGSTTGDAELVDGRVGADNHTYSNIGDAIRGQLNKKISVVDGIIPGEHTSNHIITEAVEYGYYYESTDGKKEVASESWWVHPIIPLEPNTEYRKVNCQVALYNADMTFNSYIIFNSATFTTPNTLTFAGICATVDVNTSGLYKASEYTGEYVKGRTLVTTEQIHDFTKDTKKAISDDFIKRTKGKNLFDKNGIGTPIVKGQYVEYNTGIAGGVGTLQYAEIPVVAGQTYAINWTNNVHIAFFSTPTYSQSSYISGVLNADTVTPPPNAVMMTLSCRQTEADNVQVELGSVSTDYAPYQYGLDTDDINNGSITRDKLSQEVLESLDRKTVNVGSGHEYTSILRAMKENPEKNVTFIIHTGVYDLVEEYEEYYGADYFVNYGGYQTSDPFDRGLWLDDGVRLERKGSVKLVFEYTGGNENVHKWFAPINTSQNNYCDLDIKIGDSCCRYGIHDDFAYAEGTNIFENATYEGKSFLNTFHGSGFGKSNTYILENLRFKNVGGINIAYHNNVNTGAKNKLIVKDCYCDGGIRGASYGASTEVSEMLVSGTKATNIFVVNTDDTGHNIDNIELVEWNNTIG